MEHLICFAELFGNSYDETPQNTQKTSFYKINRHCITRIPKKIHLSANFSIFIYRNISLENPDAAKHDIRGIIL